MQVRNRVKAYELFKFPYIFWYSTNEYVCYTDGDKEYFKNSFLRKKDNLVNWYNPKTKKSEVSKVKVTQVEKVYPISYTSENFYKLIKALRMANIQVLFASEYVELRFGFTRVRGKSPLDCLSYLSPEIIDKDCYLNKLKKEIQNMDWKYN